MDAKQHNHDIVLSYHCL